ncbi:hypothetical protein AB833_28750 [Chromatiales bacterium (ex Bugula neritina AB1)]|nr:hypothetical protein AB833_28750 [Chromatiales bacterium (ex Bugula neritina AB1)]
MSTLCYPNRSILLKRLALIPATLAMLHAVNSLAAAAPTPTSADSTDYTTLPVQRMGTRLHQRTSAPSQKTATKARYVTSLATLPNDPLAAQQWNFMSATTYTGAADNFNAHIHNGSSSEVIVAVVDSGVILTHEDLRTLPGYDFVSTAEIGNDGDGRDADPSDPGDWVTQDDQQSGTVSAGCETSDSSWHGTAIAGIIGAASFNDTGIAGGAPRVSLLPVRITGRCGGFIHDMIDGIRWSAGLPVAGVPVNPYPARVINLSVGFAGDCSKALQSAINDATEAGSLIVAAATNSAVDLDTTPYSPATCENVLSIAANTREGTLADYSAYGSEVFLTAPGGTRSDAIITTENGSNSAPAPESSYGYHYGTSLAAAHVSAGAATLLSIDSGLSNTELSNLLQNSSVVMSESSICRAGGCGFGRLNVNRAVRILTDEQLTDDSARPPVGAASASSPETESNSGSGLIQLPDLFFYLITLISLRKFCNN